MKDILEADKLLDGFWKIIYNDGDKIRAIRGRIIDIDYEHNFLHLDTGIKKMILPIRFLVRIESIENKEQEEYYDKQ